MSQTKSNYVSLLNALDDMKHSPAYAYAVRRGALQGAMDAIISLEVRLREIEQVPALAVPDEVEVLRAECEELRKDAERYRWITSGEDWSEDVEYAICEDGRKPVIDVAIDKCLRMRSRNEHST